MSAETAMHIMNSDNTDTMSKDCEVAFEEHIKTITKEMKKQSKTPIAEHIAPIHHAEVKAIYGDWQAIQNGYDNGTMRSSWTTVLTYLPQSRRPY